MNLSKIPRNIFQTWSTKEMSPEMCTLVQSWRNNNPNYAYFLFDDADCEVFLKKHFDKTVYDAYEKIIPGAYKADLWRYCVLYIFGGVYIDVDTMCLNGIDNFFNDEIEFIAPIDLNNCYYHGKYNLFNCFIASVPKHPILLDCIERIVFNVENNIVPHSNLDFTGPGILGKSVNKFLGNNENESFIGKEGTINNVKLLKFEAGSEYVIDVDTPLILFQNKNGSEIIKQIYSNEAKITNNINWGNTYPIKNDPCLDTNNTLVSMFYKIRDKENNLHNTGLNHTVNRYVDLAKQFLLKLPYNLIIFTDDEEIKEIINDARSNLKEKTLVIHKPFEETYYYNHLDILADLQKKFFILNGHLEHETPMYIILNNNKFDFMEHAIRLNPFNSSHFCWIDFAINHVASDPDIIHRWFHKIPDKIKQLCINPYVENVNNKDMFIYIYHHVAGGLFSGSAANLLEYCRLFREKTEQIYSEEWYQVDEAVMTMVQRENPDLFDMFYGDYKGIISNYNYPVHNMDLILSGVQKYLNYNRTKEAYNILCYCIPFFIINPNSNFICDFITKHIITDYYHNNRSILNEIVSLMVLLKSINQNALTGILNLNTSNINFYENRNILDILT